MLMLSKCYAIVVGVVFSVYSEQIDQSDCCTEHNMAGSNTDTDCGGGGKWGEASASRAVQHSMFAAVSHVSGAV